jgi:hypothetical protein
MPGQQTRTRQQTIINYQANSQVQSPQLGLGMMYRELYLTLAGTLTASQNIAGANLLNGDEWASVQRIDVLVNGTDNIISVTGEELRMWNLFQLGRPADKMILAGATSQSFVSTLILPFWDKKSHTPIDSLLNSARLSDFRVNVTWGLPSNVTSSTGSTFSVAPTLLVESRESFGISGNFSVWRRLRLSDTNVLANQAYTVNLPLGNVYRGFLINTKDSNGVDLADCIDRVQLVSGTNVYFDSDYKTLQKEYRLNSGIIVESNLANNANFGGIGLSTTSDIRAWSFIDLVDDGYLTEAIDTIALSELKLKFTTNQTIGRFLVAPSQIIPVRKPAKTS